LKKASSNFIVEERTSWNARLRHTRHRLLRNGIFGSGIEDLFSFWLKIWLSFQVAMAATGQRQKAP